MKYFAWSLCCFFLCGTVLAVSYHYIPGDSKFVRHVVLVPASREYDAIAISAHGTIPLGHDWATTAWVLISLNRDDKENKVVARLESIDQKKGILSTSHNTEPETIGNAFSPATYHRWFKSLGFDPSRPSLAAEGKALPKIVQSVAWGSKSGVAADPAVFGVLLNETTYEWMVSQRSVWVWLPYTLLGGVAGLWLTGLCFIAFDRRKPLGI
jgi:hypothetical protein